MLNGTCVQRIKGFVGVVDADGVRHLLRLGAIQMIADTDQCQDTTVIVVAGRSIIVPVPLDEVIEVIDG
jgi:hypothetical protein